MKSNSRCILVLGGARGGKSRFAQEKAAGLSDRVLFVATAEPLDEEMRRRIEEHRLSRPSHWRTLEAPREVAARVRAELGDAEVVLVDCLTLLVSNWMRDVDEGDSGMSDELRREILGLLGLVRAGPKALILVSNEVGLGLVPDNPLGRSYRDALGKANQLVAASADEVYFLVSGIPLKLKG